MGIENTITNEISKQLKNPILDLTVTTKQITRVNLLFHIL